MSLSDKREYRGIECDISCYDEEDLQEAVAELKEELFECDAVSDEAPIFDIVNKIFGEKLCQ